MPEQRVFAPEGHLRIAQQFILGLRRQNILQSRRDD
jgi:hypothetical protein